MQQARDKELSALQLLAPKISNWPEPNINIYSALTVVLILDSAKKTIILLH